MITVTVQLHAHMKKRVESPDGLVTLDVADNASIRDIMVLLSIGRLEASLFEVNTVLVDDTAAESAILRHGDKLDIYSMMTGG